MIVAQEAWSFKSEELVREFQTLLEFVRQQAVREMAIQNRVRIARRGERPAPGSGRDRRTGEGGWKSKEDMGCRRAPPRQGGRAGSGWPEWIGPTILPARPSPSLIAQLLRE